MVRVAVVTGANKGIGQAIVRSLCQKFSGDVYLTARNEQLGKAAVARVQTEGSTPHFHQLDITDSASIRRLATFLNDKYGGVDVLVNNAGVIYHPGSVPLAESAEKTCSTNYTATVNMCQAFLPLMHESGRIVNVSSRFGHQGQINDPSLKKKLLSESLTIAQLNQIMGQYVSLAKTGQVKGSAFGKSPYAISKVGVTILTRVLQRLADRLEKDVLVNACCPGYIETDMTSREARGTVEQGADTAVFLAMLPAWEACNPRGCLLGERKVIDWATYSIASDVEALGLPSFMLK